MTELNVVDYTFILQGAGLVLGVLWIMLVSNIRM